LDGTTLVDPGTVETDATATCGAEACFMGNLPYRTYPYQAPDLTCGLCYKHKFRGQVFTEFYFFVKKNNFSPKYGNVSVVMIKYP
jgi:hypothetical protein